MRVLVVEDVPRLANDIAEGLRDQGMAVDVAYDGLDAVAKLNLVAYDVVVLDRDLPGIHGDTICRMIVAEGMPVMVLMLTAADAPGERVGGLALGADDYLTKPFSFAEFLARLRALARRPTATARANRLEVGDLALDPGTRQVFRGRQEIHLTSTEYRLLEFLMRRGGGVASRRAIVEAVWGLEAEVEENTLDAFVRLLRTKVDQGYKQRLIHTVRGFGYCVRQESKE